MLPFVLLATDATPLARLTPTLFGRLEDIGVPDVGDLERVAVATVLGAEEEKAF